MDGKEQALEAAQGTRRAARRASWWRRVLERQSNAWHTTQELTAAVLGTVVGAAAMVGASVHGTLLEIVPAVLVTVAVYWIAERYAHLIAQGVHAHRLSRTHIADELRSGWPMLEAALLPLVALLVVALATGRLQAGVLTDLGVATALLGWLGVLAARRAGYRGWAALAWAGSSAVLGGLIIVLKLSLH